MILSMCGSDEALNKAKTTTLRRDKGAVVVILGYAVIKVDSLTPCMQGTRAAIPHQLVCIMSPREYSRFQ